MMTSSDTSSEPLARRMPRRDAPLTLGILGTAAFAALGGNRPAEASRRRRKKRKCKARCGRKHAGDSLGLTACRSGCGLGGGF